MQKKKTTSPYLSPLFSSIFLPHKYRSLPLFLPLYQSHSRTRCSRKMQWNPHNTHKNKNFIENYQCYVGFVNDNEANGNFFSPIYKYKNNPFRNFSKDYFPRTHFFIYTQTVNTHKQTNKYHPQTLFCNKYEDFQCKQTHTHLMQIHINTGLLFTTTEFFCYFFFCCASFVQLSFIYPVYPIMVAADFLVFVRIQFSSLEQRLFKLDKQGRRIFPFYQWNLRFLLTRVARLAALRISAKTSGELH